MRSVSSRGGSSHVRSVCSITDPFCPSAKNAKWPDGTSGNTLTEQFRGNTTVSSSPNGTLGLHFAAAAPFGYNTPSAVTATTWTTGAVYNEYKADSMLETHGKEFRIVSFGVVARSVASATNAAGLVTFGTSGGTMPLSTLHNFGTELYDEVAVKALQPGMEFSWIAKPRGPEAHSFRALSTATNLLTDWTNLTIEITGATISVPVLNIEWYMNIEFSVAPNNALSAIARPNPPSIPAAATATSHVHHNLGSFFEGGVALVEKAVYDSASQALTTLTRDPFASLASLASMF